MDHDYMEPPQWAGENFVVLVNIASNNGNEQTFAISDFLPDVRETWGRLVRLAFSSGHTGGG